ncbi:hypothetical protein [Pseudomonas serboccidentalis]|uniref:hypothetical protein n=1 Tax=Pseudomonas serboccidentalis TaxID=2964670 RepID=UPI0039E16C32
MNDQVKLNEQGTLVQPPNKREHRIYTAIIGVSDGQGNEIPHDGTALSDVLSFKGHANPNQLVQIFDRGNPAHDDFFPVDDIGNFFVTLPNQERGSHIYSAHTLNGEVSRPWVIFVDVPETASIEYVSGRDGENIEPGGATSHDELHFVGRGTAYQTVDLLDNGKVIQTLNVDAARHWSAHVKELQTGSHEFIVRGEDGELSNPWRVLIELPAPLSTQFVIGQVKYQLIKQHGSTADRTITLVGTAHPEETGWIADYRGNLVRFRANQNGVYQVTIAELRDGVHALRVVSDKDKISEPYFFRVVPLKL